MLATHAILGNRDVIVRAIHIHIGIIAFAASRLADFDPVVFSGLGTDRSTVELRCLRNQACVPRACKGNIGFIGDTILKNLAAIIVAINRMILLVACLASAQIASLDAERLVATTILLDSGLARIPHLFDIGDRISSFIAAFTLLYHRSRTVSTTFDRICLVNGRSIAFSKLIYCRGRARAVLVDPCTIGRQIDGFAVEKSDRFTPPERTVCFVLPAILFDRRGRIPAGFLVSLNDGLAIP